MQLEPEVLAALITGGVGMFSAMAACVVSFLKSRKAKHDLQSQQYQNELTEEYLEALEKSRAYIICPHCCSEISTESLEVHFKDMTELEKVMRSIKEKGNGTQTTGKR